MASILVKYECRVPPETTDLSMADMYDLALEQIAWIDAQNVPVTINFCEHHGSDDGYLPSPIVMASAAARITRNVRLQANVLVPFSDPLRVAEDVAVLDNLSHGRAEVLLLGGYVESEMTMFGVDPKQRGTLMEEGVKTLKQAWRGETFEFRGRPVRVTPRPVQQPHPPIFMGGSSPPAARRAAREADGFIAGMPNLNPIYEAECLSLGKTPRYQGDMAFAYLYVSEDPDRDWQRLAPFGLHETNCYARWQSSTDLDMMYSSAMDEQTLRSLGTYQLVTPEQVLAKAPQLAPNDVYVLHPLVSGLEADLSWTTLKNFFEKVVPYVEVHTQ